MTHKLLTCSRISLSVSNVKTYFYPGPGQRPTRAILVLEHAALLRRVASNAKFVMPCQLPVCNEYILYEFSLILQYA
jgi:hypothetical protein